MGWWSRRENFLDRPTLLARVGVAILGQKLPDIRRGGKCAHSLHIFSEETDDGFEHGADRPGGVPLLGVILRDCEANLGVGLEPSILVHEDDIGRLERILIGEQDLAVVQSLVEIGVLWALKGEVPRVKIVLQGSSIQVGQFFLLQFLGLGHDALLADIGRLHMCKNIISFQKRGNLREGREEQSFLQRGSGSLYKFSHVFLLLLDVFEQTTQCSVSFQFQDIIIKDFNVDIHCLHGLLLLQIYILLISVLLFQQLLSYLHSFSLYALLSHPLFFLQKLMHFFLSFSLFLFPFPFQLLLLDQFGYSMRVLRSSMKK